MSKSLPQERMTVEEFLVWAEAQEGRYELHNGQIVAMSPERAEHVEMKFNVTSALKAAIGRAGLPCFAYVDGLAVRIDAATTFEPDAMVVCGEKVPRDQVAASSPVIVVEVLSPSTGYVDFGAKLEGYFPRTQSAPLPHHRSGDAADRATPTRSRRRARNAHLCGWHNQARSAGIGISCRGRVRRSVTTLG